MFVAVAADDTLVVVAVIQNDGVNAVVDVAVEGNGELDIVVVVFVAVDDVVVVDYALSGKVQPYFSWHYQW